MSNQNGTTAAGPPALRRRPKAQPRKVNGKEYPTKVEATEEQFAAAIAHEDSIAAEAAEIRAEATTLSPELFLKLWPLLRRPIPSGFIVETSRGDGKPYDSRGIRSVQVSVNRMDNVLTPLWWHQQVDYHEDGKLCEVTVIVDVDGSGIRRSAWGGVDRGNTRGNLMKGSYTNAGKLAFARLGVGGEVYLGAADFDPDVNPAAAAEQTKTDRPAAGQQVGDTGKPIGKAKARELVDVAWTLGLKDKLQLAASHVVGEDVGDCSDQESATKALTDLTQVQAAKVENWLSRKADALNAEDVAKLNEAEDAKS